MKQFFWWLFGGGSSNTVTQPSTATHPSVSAFDSQWWMPWAEPVTYTSVRPNSANVSTVVERAGAYQLGNGEISPSFGVYTRYDVKFTIGQADLPYTPKPRDQIVWGGDTYTALEVIGSNWMQFHAITARNLILHSDLRSTGTLSRPSATQDTTGRAALTSYSTVTSNIPCRVQQQPSNAGDPFQRRTLDKLYTAFVGVLLDARAKDKFTVGSTVYTVTAVRNPERIDQLQELDLELIN